MPLITNKKQFTKGLTLLILFFGVLALFFMPIFNGQTGMEYADDLFNSLSKGSSYYIPDAAAEVEGFKGTALSADIETNEPGIVAMLFEKAGAEASINNNVVTVQGDLGMIAEAAVIDSDDLFNNREENIIARYDTDQPRALVYYWHESFEQLERNYFYNGNFDESSFLTTVMTRALEPAYNFYGIASSQVSERVGITSFLLAFYVVYTLWFGFGIMYLFEGLGISASKH